MTISDEEDEILAKFLESEVLSEVSDQDQEEETEEAKKEEIEPKGKRVRFQETQEEEKEQNQKKKANNNNNNKGEQRRIKSGILSKIPPELFPHILKFLSSEDLIACSLVCRFLNFAASDESLWRRLSVLLFFSFLSY